MIPQACIHATDHWVIKMLSFVNITTVDFSWRRPIVLKLRCVKLANPQSVMLSHEPANHQSPDKLHQALAEMDDAKSAEAEVRHPFLPLNLITLSHGVANHQVLNRLQLALVKMEDADCIEA